MQFCELEASNECVHPFSLEWGLNYRIFSSKFRHQLTWIMNVLPLFHFLLSLHASGTCFCRQKLQIAWALHIFYRSIPWADGENVIHRKGRRKRMGISPRTRTDNTSLHWETAEPLLTPLRSCYTLQQPQMAGSHVLVGSVGTNQQPLGASRHFQFFTELCISACFLATSPLW